MNTINAQPCRLPSRRVISSGIITIRKMVSWFARVSTSRVLALPGSTSLPVERPRRVGQGALETVRVGRFDLEPGDLLLPPEPRQLPLRVAPRIPLGQRDRLGEAQRAPQV